MAITAATQLLMKERAAQHAASLVEQDMVIGLGSGSTATCVLHALAARWEQGLRFTGVSTSAATEDLARSLGFSLASLDTHPRLDLALDGADEVDPSLQLIKGLGGALVREKIVATAAARFVVIVDTTKRVSSLGVHAPLPVEVLPFGWLSTRQRLESLGARVELRMKEGQPFVSDGGNFILDCRFHTIDDMYDLGTQIKGLTGVVDHGLFWNMAHQVIVGHVDRVELLSRS